MPFAVPQLAYPYDALEPTIDEATMRLHHDKHHQAYVDKANAALAGSALEGGGGEPSGELAAAIGDTFGSFGEFTSMFEVDGAARFGSGGRRALRRREGEGPGDRLTGRSATRDAPRHPERARRPHPDVPHAAVERASADSHPREEPMTTITMPTAGPVVSAGTYDVDTVHSRIGFAVRHLGINVVRGMFLRFAATIEVGDEPGGLTVTGSVEARSVDTGYAMRDDHLRTADFFDVDHHPEIVFTSTSTTPIDRRDLQVAGDITIRGVTRPIVLAAEIGGSALDQYGNERLGFTAQSRLRRSDFGLPFAQAPGGIALVADTIELSLDVEAVRRP